VLLIPLIGAVVYLIARGGKMQERKATLGTGARCSRTAIVAGEHDAPARASAGRLPVWSGT